MPIKQKIIGNYILIYDDITNKIISFETTELYKKLQKEATLKILSNKDDLKQRGATIVKKEAINSWNNFVDNSLVDLDQVWYNGVIIEAALKCMEKLSQEVSIEEAYKPIDIQNPNLPCIHFNMKLSEWQNYSATKIIGTYHRRGQEFCNYRNNLINKNHKVKKKQIC